MQCSAFLAGLMTSKLIRLVTHSWKLMLGRCASHPSCLAASQATWSGLHSPATPPCHCPEGSWQAACMSPSRLRGHHLVSPSNCRQAPCITSNCRQAGSELATRDALTGWHCRRAVIVAPKTLLAQWEKELSRCGMGSLLSEYFGTSQASRQAGSSQHSTVPALLQQQAPLHAYLN